MRKKYINMLKKNWVWLLILAIIVGVGMKGYIGSIGEYKSQTLNRDVFYCPSTIDGKQIDYCRVVAYVSNYEKKKYCAYGIDKDIGTFETVFTVPGGHSGAHNLLPNDYIHLLEENCYTNLYSADPKILVYYFIKPEPTTTTVTTTTIPVTTTTTVYTSYPTTTTPVTTTTVQGCSPIKPNCLYGEPTCSGGIWICPPTPAVTTTTLPSVCNYYQGIDKIACEMGIDTNTLMGIIVLIIILIGGAIIVKKKRKRR